MENLPPENLLQHIWQHKYLLSQKLYTTNNEEIKVLKPGQLNAGPGPDFFEARIKLCNTIWVGNLEIHVKSSDWRKHKHQADLAYQNIILHVVYVHDEEIFDASGHQLPTLELKDYIPKNLLEQYSNIMKSKTAIPCQNQFRLPDEMRTSIFIEQLIVERLHEKHLRIIKQLSLNQNHWQAMLIEMLFQYSGMGINKQPMEQLLTTISIGLIQKYKQDKEALLALLIGSSGLGFKENEAHLEKRFLHLKIVHKLETTSIPIWKKGGIRPSSFPEVRLANLATLLNSEMDLFSKIINFKDPKELIAIISSYGKTFGDGLLINVFLPIKFAYDNFIDQPNAEVLILDTLEHLLPEQNSCTKTFKDLGITIKNAKDSQAFIHLKKNYCSQKKCLSCQFASHLFKESQF